MCLDGAKSDFKINTMLLFLYSLGQRTLIFKTFKQLLFVNLFRRFYENVNKLSTVPFGLALDMTTTYVIYRQTLALVWAKQRTLKMYIAVDDSTRLFHDHYNFSIHIV